MRHPLITILTLLVLGACQTAPSVQHGTDFNFDWKFTLGDDPAFAESMAPFAAE